MKIFKKILMLCMMSALCLTTAMIGVEAKSGAILKIVANSRVGANDREVYSFDMTVSDKTLLEGLTAEDFDITGNKASTVLDANTGSLCQDFADDGIELSVNDNVLTMNVKQFAYSNDDWKVECAKNPDLDFTRKDIDQVNTDTLDEAIIGTFTYAGLSRKYALYVPKDANGPVPLVVWNHGGGEYAIDIETNLIKNKGLTAWPEAGYKTAVLMIQVSNENYSYGTSENEAKKQLIDQNNALQAALIKKLIAEGKVDEKRVYVTGASSGGGATMRFLMQYPEMFAGAIACCSMDPIVTVHNQSYAALKKEKDSFETIVNNFEKAFQDKVYTWDEAKGAMVEKQVNTQSLLNVPVYFTHAENDPVCSVTSSKAMYQAMSNLGDTNNKLTIWSDEDMAKVGISNSTILNGTPVILHWSWVKLFNEVGEGTPMNWLFKQTKTTQTETPIEKPTEKPVDTNKTSTSVKTGDDSAIAVMASIMMLSAGAYVTIKKYAR